MQYLILFHCHTYWVFKDKNYIYCIYYFWVISLSPISEWKAFIIIYCIRYLGFLDLINYFHLFILSLLYIGPKDKNLRKIKYLKPFIISYIWAMSIVAPYYYDNIITPSLVFILEFFSFILYLAIIFDFRDRNSDAIEGIKTFAQKLPLKRLKIILMMLVIFSSLFSLIYFCFSYFLVLNIIANLLVIIALNDTRNSLYYLVLVDGLIGLRAFLLFYTT